MGGPILQIGAAEIQDVADGALVDILFRKLYGRRFAVIEGNHGLHAVFPGSPVHLPCLFRRQRKRFFAENVLSCFRGGNSNFRVHIIGRTDVYNLNFRIIDNVVPVRGIGFKGQLFFRVLCNVFVHIYDHFLYWDCRSGPEKHGHTRVCDGMSLCHKACADQSDMDFLWVHMIFSF